YKDRSSPFRLPEGRPAALAADLYERDIRQGTSPVAATCEECGQQYVYFPGSAAEAQAAKVSPEYAKHQRIEATLAGRALAPCPRCGRIQRNMYGCARDQAPVSPLM